MEHKPREWNDQWLVNIPELATRATLRSLIQTNRGVRKRLFQTAQALESIALIPARNTAGRCLSLFWREERRSIYRYYHDKLRAETGTDQAFNELYGCLRNVYRNMMVKCGMWKEYKTCLECEVVRIYE